MLESINKGEALTLNEHLKLGLSRHLVQLGFVEAATSTLDVLRSQIA